jgi:hypothetical protein
MRIEATCDTCGRKFLLSQIGPDSDAPGRCPFCGARFGRHYTTVLVEATEEAERAATSFTHSMRRLLSMERGFDVDVDKHLAEISEQIKAADVGQVA